METVQTTVECRFAGQTREVARARAFVKGALPAGADGSMLLVLVSEAATNAIVHGGCAGKDFTVKAVVDGLRVRVEVADRGGPTVPVVRPADMKRVGGRGVALLDELAEEWGWKDVPGGRVVWFSVLLA